MKIIPKLLKMSKKIKRKKIEKIVFKYKYFSFGITKITDIISIINFQAQLCLSLL